MTYVILTLSNPWKVDSMEVEMAQLTTSIKEITMVSMQQKFRVTMHLFDCFHSFSTGFAKYQRKSC